MLKPGLMFILIITTAAVLLTSCSQGAGNAPSNPSTTDGGDSNPGSGSGDSVFKYGEEQQSANGWTVQYDSTDFVEMQNLANGWTVEVMYE